MVALQLCALQSPLPQGPGWQGCGGGDCRKYGYCQYTIYIYGAGASAAIAQQMQSNVMQDWNNGGAGWQYTDLSTGSVFSVQFDVSVQLYDSSNPTDVPNVVWGSWNPLNTDNYVEVVSNPNQLRKTKGASYVLGGDEGKWRSYGPDPSSHEFGHLIGLKDRYTRNRGANSGWAGNVMAEPARMGRVQQKNINSLMSPVMGRYNKAGRPANYKTKIDENKPWWENINESQNNNGINYAN